MLAVMSASGEALCWGAVGELGCFGVGGARLGTCETEDRGVALLRFCVFCAEAGEAGSDCCSWSCSGSISALTGWIVSSAATGSVGSASGSGSGSGIGFDFWTGAETLRVARVLVVRGAGTAAMDFLPLRVVRCDI